MAVWGTPVAREDDIERAVRAALELVDAVAALPRVLTVRRGVTDPVWDEGRSSQSAQPEVDGERSYFCSEHCLHAFERGHDGRALSAAA